MAKTHKELRSEIRHLSARQKVSVAPMMDWTDRHCRYFLRLISPNVRLYTEMVTTGAILHGDRDRFLRFDGAEHPIALQLGGSNPEALAECAKIGEEFGYDEINLNCGCPSDRVQSGMFGACLMDKPDLVAKCYEAMASACSIPITIKSRIGIDNKDDFVFLDKFVGSLVDKSCKTFVIHARKAWLSGLSPKENREVPELNYERVYEIKKKYPNCHIGINGGITTIDQAKEQLLHIDEVMIGREAYQNPYILAGIETEIFKNRDIHTRENVALAMISYIEEQQEQYDTPIKSITRHMIGLFQGLKGAKKWRQALSTLPYEGNPTAKSVIETALERRLQAEQKQAA